MKSIKKFLCCGLILAILLPVAGCTTKAPVTDDPAATEPEQVLMATVNGIPAVYLSVPGNFVKFDRQEDSTVKVYDVSELDDTSGVVINVDAGTTHQEILGWGAAMTESSAINLWDMPEELRNQVMVSLFDEDEGIGLNILRQPNGISDFSTDPEFSYAPVRDDLTLEHFTLGKHEEQIIPLLQQAKELVNDDENFRVFLCSWTAPLWMKTIEEFHSLNQSTLKREYYQLFADYLVKSIQAYESHGIPIYAITDQNEPTGIHSIAAMYMNTDNHASLINMYLKPSLEKAGLETKVMCWDFNTGASGTKLLGKTYSSVDAMCFHAYNDDFTEIAEIHEMYPDLPIYMTEAAGRTQSNAARFFRQMKWLCNSQIIGSSAHILWNIVLDEEYGPALLDEDGNSVNTIGIGMLEWNRQEQKVAYLEDFYALAHFSKFVRPGAVRLESTDTREDFKGLVANVVYRNENGTMTAVLCNQNTAENTFKLVVGDKVIEYTLPAMSAATITWDGNVY